MESREGRGFELARCMGVALAAALWVGMASLPAPAQETDLQTIAAPPRMAKPKPAKLKAAKPKVATKAPAKPRKLAAHRAKTGAAAPRAATPPMLAAPTPAAPARLDPMPTGTVAAVPPGATARPSLTSSSYPMPADAVPIPEEKFGAAPAATVPAGAPPAIAAAPSPGAPAAGPPAEMQPLTHARNAGVGLCLDALGRAAATAIDADHDAYSTWATRDADAHLFQSIALMRYPNQVAPRSASVLLVTPNAAKSCEGGTVQVVPTARSCAAIQAQLMQGGKAIATLTGLPLIENLAGVRQILLPATGNGCVMISVGLIAAAPPAPVAAQK